MDHDTPKERDTRVDKFNQDLWQRELFDVVDNREPALIIAPTSSGKPYASYYCMKNVLKKSNDGVVVYISPTQILVNQSKEKEMVSLERTHTEMIKNMIHIHRFAYFIFSCKFWLEICIHICVARPI